jgi:trk system potassium uptake protein TrkA
LRRIFVRILITGAGEVGFYVANALCGEHDITVVDKDSKACSRLEEMDVNVVQGNGANARLLSQVGIKGTNVVLALTGNDEVNLITCITANKMGVKKTIARVSNPEYIDQPVESRKQIGITHMICPELLMAEEIARSSLYFPSMILNRKLDGGRGELIEIRVSRDMPLQGLIEKITLPENCAIMAIKRNGRLMHLKDDTVIEKDDHLILICENGRIVELRSLLHEDTASNNVMIVGGGVVGFYLAKRLGEMNFELKLVEIDKQRCQEIAEELPDTLILNGDGADISLLKEENVNDMDVVFSVTGIDEKNLLCSLLAKQLGAKKIVTRVNRRDYIELFEMVGVDRAVSPGKVTVDAVLRLVEGGEDLVTLGDERRKIMEFVARKNADVVGKTIGKKIPKSAIVSMILRNGIPIVPTEGDLIEENDHVFVFTLPTELSRVKKLFAA